MARSLARLSVAAMSLAMGAAWAQFTPAPRINMTRQDESWLVTAEAYRVVVAADGCLTNLFVNGIEFLAPGIGVSRGSYFYRDAPLRLPRVSRVPGNQIVAEGDLASIRYGFSSDRMTWTLTNRTDTKLSFYVVLDRSVRAGRSGEGEWARTPVSAPWEQSVWYRGGAFLAISGATSVWGPWGDGNQVIDVTLSPKEVRRIELTMGTAGRDERATADEVAGQPDTATGGGRDRDRDPDRRRELIILSPRDLQVFQRQSRREGPMLISGRVNVEADAVEARIEGRSAGGPISSRWFEVPFVPETGAFNGTTVQAAGGWYRLQVRALRGGAVVAEGTVPRFGIGEVFVTAGQSNSTNSGQFRTKQTSGMVSSFSGSDWRIANDPQPGTHDNSEGGSPWPAFGDAMYQRFGVPIGIAATGHGGTSVNQWRPGDELFSWMMTRVYQLGPCGFRAMLWHQGESDVEMPSREYAQKLEEVIESSKLAAGWEFPWFVAQVSYHSPQQPRFTNPREGQRQLLERGIALPGPDTDTLTGDHRDMDGEGIHFSPKGLKAHGEMWAQHVGDYLEAVLRR